MNELIVKEYLGNGIEFKVVDGVVYANANKMAEAFGGRIKLDNWKRSENTKRYIDALQEKALRENYDTKLILVKQGGKSNEQGTWIHEKLILSFARYLNVDFEIWADEQIATLLREGEVSISKVKDSYMIEDPIERAKRWIEEYEEKKQLEQNLVKTREKLEHKQEVVNCLVDEVKLKTQRQFLNEIIKMKGVELISTRWNILYKSYEQNKHINLKARIEAYNLIHKPKIKNKLEYIEVVLQDIPKLYSIAVKLFESDFKDKLKKYYEAL